MFLSLPEYTNLTRGHCLLTPLEHVGSMNRADQEAVNEACTFKRDLCRMANMWEGTGASYVFMEIASYPGSFKHHVQIECVPVDRETMEVLPSYFKVVATQWNYSDAISLFKSNSSEHLNEFYYFAIRLESPS